jgi:hypothetical protein
VLPRVVEPGRHCCPRHRQPAAAATGKMAARSTSTATKLFERFYHDFSLYDKFFAGKMSKGQYVAA